MEDYYYAIPCDKLDYLIGSQQAVVTLFPSCTIYYNGQDPNAAAAVIDYMNGRTENVAAALDASFGMALWLALFLHAAGVEIYVSYGYIIERSLLEIVEFDSSGNCTTSSVFV
jgi:hypothetical protein